MRQVFFKTVSALQAAAGTAGDARFNDLSSGELGFWTLDAATGGDWFATDLFTATVDTVAVAKAIPFYKNFQVVQGFPSNNPIASPIISNQNLVKVTADPYAASVRHEVNIAPAAADNGDDLNIKVVIRNTPTDYLSYVNNESIISDLSGGGYDFPLGVYNTTNHKVINLAVTGGANEAGTVDNIVTAITNNNTWNALFETTDNGNDVDLTARHIGVVFDVIFENLSATPSSTQGTLVNAWSAGSGNDWQARADELKAREYAGNFNRMYFPQSYTDFVADASTWKRYEITYRTDGDRDVVKGSEYGSCIIYEANADDVVKDVLNASTALTASTEYLF
jgi:hypothetical protein